MSKFAQTATTARPQGPLHTLPGVQTRTHEGGLGFVKDARTELFSLGVANFVAEDTYYEKAGVRDKRFTDLVREVTALDPDWVAHFIPWLRQEANMRTASVVAAIEYARAAPGTNGRAVIAQTLTRADEPAEALAYWMSLYGRKIPKAVKRGIADAVVKLYTQNAAMKYDSRDAKMRMGDVIDLVHPNPHDALRYWEQDDMGMSDSDVELLKDRVVERKRALFQYLLDKRHGRDNPRGLDRLGKISARKDAIKAAAEGGELDVTTGMTWETALSLGGSNAETWQKVIPQMGYMALLRNLRNFEDAKLPANVLMQVASTLADPEQVAKSRQFPFRFLSAWSASGSMMWGQALELALEASCANIPEFPGKTLIMVDVSGSMDGKMSAKSTVSRKVAGAVFGAAVMKRSAPGSKLGVYATLCAVQDKPRSVLRTAEEIGKLSGVGGHGTNTWPSTWMLWQEYGPFDRILIFTDEQHHPSHITAGSFPKDVPIYVWCLGGYRPASLDLGTGRYLLAGLNDQCFKLIKILEAGSEGRWPWEVD
jgi:hypothetical protein